MAILAGLVSIICGAFMMYIAWQHNPQCAIHCRALGMDWGQWLAIGISWVATSLVVCAVCLGLFAAVAGVIRDTKAGQ